MDTYLYRSHDWILDTGRAKQSKTILSELIVSGRKLGVRFVWLTGWKPDRYCFVKFLIAAASETALNQFETIATKWGFGEWAPMPEEAKFTSVLRSPTYEIIEGFRLAEDGSVDLGRFDIAYWQREAQNNEDLAGYYIWAEKRKCRW